jgi:hypothetical protein
MKGNLLHFRQKLIIVDAIKNKENKSGNFGTIYSADGLASLHVLNA